jgi:N-hydroxyarylamine O-acetyltransferase
MERKGMPMRDDFDLDAWLDRIGHGGPRTPNLSALRGIVAAHTATIPFENADVLLGRVPKLDLASLQEKMISGRRGGYCFELNSLLEAGLTAMGFTVTSLLARVIRGMSPDASGPATHMLLRVDLPEGPYLADVGFGNQTPTSPLALRPGDEQKTPHETMRLWPVGEELTLQVKRGPQGGDEWENIYRMSPHPRLPVDYEVANWFTATHPASPFVSNFIVARPGPGGARNTLFNGRVTIRRPGEKAERLVVTDDEFRGTLMERFGLDLSVTDITAAIEALDRKGTRGAQHPFFA